MKKSVFLFVFILCTYSCVSIKKYNNEIYSVHSVSELSKDVDIAYTQLQKFHPKLYQYVTKEKLDSLFASLKNEIDKPINSYEFYERLAQVIKEIRQGHLMLHPPTQKYSKAQLKELRKLKFEFFELDFELLNNKLWVKGTRGADSTIVGHEVLAVNQEFSKKLVYRYKSLITSDGYNKTYYNRFVGKNFSNFYYAEKGFMDSLNLLLKNRDSIYFKTLKWINKGVVFAKHTDSIASARKLTSLEKLAIKEKQKTKRKEGRTRGYVPQRDHFLRNLEFIGEDNSVAYLKIRSFGDGNQRKFYRETFAEIKRRKVVNLIIDLRDNGGGSIAEIKNLYSYIAVQPFQLVNKAAIKTKIPATKAMISSKNSSFFEGILQLFAIPGLLVYDFLHVKTVKGNSFYNLSESKLKKPKKNNYKGNIYVLINGYSFSASSILATNLKATKRAIFVGEETGGAYNGTVAGQYKYVTLPNSLVSMKIGLMQIESPYKSAQIGYGIQPDMKIIPSQKDRLIGKDPELDWVLNSIFNVNKN
ncbi:peptidase S41 [Kriegella sp. EG-1]|nr:peptidase S41 [Flavobacteriaceae bacterium EG-1]